MKLIFCLGFQWVCPRVKLIVGNPNGAKVSNQTMLKFEEL